MIDERAGPIRPIAPGVIGDAAFCEHGGCEPRLRRTPTVPLGKDIDQKTAKFSDLLLQKLQPMARRLSRRLGLLGPERIGIRPAIRPREIGCCRGGNGLTGGNGLRNGLGWPVCPAVIGTGNGSNGTKGSLNIYNARACACARAHVTREWKSVVTVALCRSA
jgi:hypothetical protein